MNYELPEWFKSVLIFNKEVGEYIYNGYHVLILNNSILLTGLLKNDSDTFIHHIAYVKGEQLTRKEVYLTINSTIKIFYEVGKFEYRSTQLTYQEYERENYECSYLSGILTKLNDSSIDLIDRVDFIVKDTDQQEAMEYNVSLYDRVYSDYKHGSDIVYKNGKYFSKINRDKVFLDYLIKEKNKQK